MILLYVMVFLYCFIKQHVLLLSKHQTFLNHYLSADVYDACIFVVVVVVVALGANSCFDVLIRFSGRHWIGGRWAFCSLNLWLGIHPLSTMALPSVGDI